MTATGQYASVRYVVDDVPAAIGFYTTHLGFTLNTSAAPAFADVVRGPLRLLLSGPDRSAHRPPPPPPAATASTSSPATWTPRSPGSGTQAWPSAASSRALAGRQILLADPAGNPIELFQPAHRPASPEEAS